MKPNYKLAADAIQVMVRIIKETGVPNHKVLKAVEWALENLGDRQEKDKHG